jgi:hypothetical protein
VHTEGGIFYTEQDQGTGEDRDAYEPATALRIFGDFLRNFREHSADGPALYRDALDHHPAPRVLRVALDDLRAHDPTLAQLLRNDPSAYVPMVCLPSAHHPPPSREAASEEGRPSPRTTDEHSRRCMEAPKVLRQAARARKKYRLTAG